jgi:hypothetical protein
MSAYAVKSTGLSWARHTAFFLQLQAHALTDVIEGLILDLLLETHSNRSTSDRERYESGTSLESFNIAVLQLVIPVQPRPDTSSGLLVRKVE